MAGVVGPVPLEDAHAIAEMMVMTERAPAPGEWVESLIARADDDRTRSMLDMLI